MDTSSIDVGKIEGRPVYAVGQFKEKPDLATAKEYVASGKFYWNAGMFFWRGPVIGQCLADFGPLESTSGN